MHCWLAASADAERADSNHWPPLPPIPPPADNIYVVELSTGSVLLLPSATSTDNTIAPPVVPIGLETDTALKIGFPSGSSVKGDSNYYSLPQFAGVNTEAGGAEANNPFLDAVLVKCPWIRRTSGQMPDSNGQPGVAKYFAGINPANCTTLVKDLRKDRRAERPAAARPPPPALAPERCS